MKITYRKVMFGAVTEPMYDMSPEHFLAMVKSEISDERIAERLLHLVFDGKPVRLLGHEFIPLPHPVLESQKVCDSQGEERG